MVNNRIRLMDILGVLAYLLMAGSCFLPFLNYTTLTSVETITYFQGNGKLILGFSLLAILFIVLKFFKYTFMCLGLTIGVLIYDITFGLLQVVKEKTTVYGLRYGFYLIALGMLINLIYIIIKTVVITKEYNKQYESSSSNAIEILEIDGYNNPQMQLSNDSDKDNLIEASDAEEMLALEIESNKNETEEEIKPLSIFNEIPDFEMANEVLKNDKSDIVNGYSSEPLPLYKLCDGCGMQINYNDDICPVCGKQF